MSRVIYLSTLAENMFLPSYTGLLPKKLNTSTENPRSTDVSANASLDESLSYLSRESRNLLDLFFVFLGLP